MTVQDVERLQHEIAQTRADLSVTMQALVVRADVRTRARDRAEVLRADAEVRVRVLAIRARATAEQARHTASGLLVSAREAVPPAVLEKAPPVAAGATGAGLAAVAVVKASRRRRRRRLRLR